MEDEFKDFDLGIDLSETESFSVISEPIPTEVEEKEKKKQKKEFVIKRRNSGRNGFILVSHDGDLRLLPFGEWADLKLREISYSEDKFKKLVKPKWRK